MAVPRVEALSCEARSMAVFCAEAVSCEARGLAVEIREISGTAMSEVTE